MLFLTGLTPPLATTFLLFFFTGGGRRSSSSLELSSLELFTCSFLFLPFKFAFLGAIFGGAFTDFFILDFLAGAAELPEEDELDALLELAAEELELAELDLELLLETDRDLCFLTGILETFLLGLATGLGERLFFLVIFLGGDGDFRMDFLWGLAGFRLAVFRPRFTGETERFLSAAGIFCHFLVTDDVFGDPLEGLRTGDRFGDPRDDFRAGDLFGDPLEALLGDLRGDFLGDLLFGDPLDDLLGDPLDDLLGDPLEDLLGDLLGDLIGDLFSDLAGDLLRGLGDLRLLDLFKLLLRDLLPAALPFERLLLLFGIPRSSPTFGLELALTGLLLACRLSLFIVKRKFERPLGFTVILRSGDPLAERVESLRLRTSRASLGVVDVRLSGFKLGFIGDSAILVAGLPSSRANKLITSLNRFLGAGRLCFGSHRSS